MFCPSFEKYEVSQANRLRGGVDGEATDELSRRLSARDPLLLASVEIWIGVADEQTRTRMTSQTVGMTSAA